MLRLENINKNYGDKDNTINALKNITLRFRKNEFVSILGPSGCGKTTLLNIIGGLDKYTSGDLIINGRSTVEYKDKDWDAYRNRTIGFVFQDYNLIQHLSLVENVELSMALTGIKSKERKARALEALKVVGLEAHAKKKPNQLSGGQKQRVAIARAIVNKPDIILADEPTGALDSKTSVQIMDILKGISKDCLVIMVTHNNELAEEYSTRIINLLDGEIKSDTNPYKDTKKVDEKKNKLENSADKLEKAHTGMNLGISLGISFKNLLTKKARTILTAIASSIGIVGIALVLAISNGFNIYIDNMQRETLATLPVTISPSVLKGDYTDISEEMYDNIMGTGQDRVDVIISYNKNPGVLFRENKITQDYIDYVENMDTKLYNFISYGYNMNVHIATCKDGNYSYLNEIKTYQMAQNQDYLVNEYPLVANGGRYPQNANEIVLVLNNKGQINENILHTLNLSKGEAGVYNPTDFLGKTYKCIPNNAYFEKTSSAPIKYQAKAINESVYNDAENIELKIVGIVKNNSASSKYDMQSMMGKGSSSEGIGISALLIKQLHDINMVSNVCNDQRVSDFDIVKGSAFSSPNAKSIALQNLGGYALPTLINIYTTNFDEKVKLKQYLDKYNIGKEEKDKILYTDASEILSDTFSGMLDATSIVLIIFAAISLLVSSIMIGIITYVSVIERTKEIGVLRSLGARKRDIASVFNAETFLIGIVAGVIGILFTLLSLWPINAIISTMAHGVEVSAILNPWHALVLIALSTILTLVSGLIPASIASKKEPVKCLRTE